MKKPRDQIPTETMSVDEREPRRTGGCVLYVMDGDERDVRRHHVLRRGSVIVGGSPKCDLVLNDPRVSRRHLEVAAVPGGVRVRDLGSTNGTQVMGEPIRESVVAAGTQVHIGATTLVLLALDADDELAPSDEDHYGQLFGVSVAMRRVFASLRRLEGTALPVLITGETGTGKELVARALHDHGPCRQGPFVVFDCGATPRELLESELFGHLPGAFTGAQRERRGLVEEADGGTLFVDEVGELPLDLQTRLLRVLDRQEVKRLGQNDYRRVNVRVVAATHRRLGEWVRDGKFREDLFYRLAVATLELPPLRERAGDVPLLAARFASELGGAAKLDPATLAEMSRHAWPGNVRELRAAVQRHVTFGSWALPEVGAAPPAPAGRSPSDSGFHEAKQRLLEDFEVDYLRELLARHRGNVSAAAREAGLSRKHIRELIAKHELTVERKPAR